MNKLYRFCFCLFLVVSSISASPVFAQFMPVPTNYYVAKVKDINPNGTSVVGAGPVVEFGGKAYFSADNGSNGMELWVTDGTEAGTMMLKNINPNGASSPHNLTVMNGTLFFTADNGSDGRELWKTNGTSSGTQLVKNINLSGDASPSCLTANGTTLFFSADNGSTGQELWKSDGTAAGTVIVKNINPSGDGVDASTRFKVYNGKVYFAGSTQYNTELWVSDGTSAGTQQVKDINPDGNSSPRELTVCNGLLFFSANGSSGTGLWKSDGTNAGTQLVKVISPTMLTTVGTTLFFSGENATYGDELWKSDGTTAGTVMVRNLNSSGGAGIYSVMALQNQAFFLRHRRQWIFLVEVGWKQRRYNESEVGDSVATTGGWQLYLF
jgi:ELWxxDGT repeat protein